MRQFLRGYWQLIKGLRKNTGVWLLILIVLSQNRTLINKVFAVILLILVTPLFQPWPESDEDIDPTTSA
jgi:hypothetical protein